MDNQPQAQTAPWISKAGYVTGILTLVFFMAMVVASLFGYNVPANSRFVVVVVLAFGTALSFAFFGGTAAAHGSIPIPFSEQKPIAFSVTGGIAVFIIVLALGYYLYLPPNRTFTATVTPLDNGAVVNTLGKIQIQYGDYDPVQDISSSGQAEFKLIPIQYLGQKVKVWPKIPGYQEQFQEVVLTDSGMNINLRKIDTVFRGQLMPVPQKGKKVKVTIDGEPTEATPDEYGRFEITVHGKYDGNVRVHVWVDGVEKYDDFQQLLGPANILLHK
jgi:hypothetical protein